MNIVFMGTPEFAVGPLNALFHSQHKIISVVTLPDKIQGRGLQIKASAVKEAALKLNLPLLQPENFLNIDFIKQIKELSPDLIVVVAFKKLPSEIFEIPHFGTINIHASLLPKYRGAAPINHALFNGDEETGVTTFYINEDIDSGVILMQRSITIDPEDNLGSLYQKLSELASDLIVETCDKLDHEGIVFKVQDSSQASKAPKITQDSLKIDWNQSAKNIHNRIRGLSPYPAAYSILNSKKIKLLKSKLSGIPIQEEKIGSISILDNHRFFVACKDSFIEILECQPESKKSMSARDFINGNPHIHLKEFES